MAIPAWLHNDGGRRERNRRSARQETDRAEQVSGRRQPGSGSSYRAPQDIRGTEHLEQIKFTDSARYTLSVYEWINLRADAYRSGREPRLVIDFPVYGIRLVVMEEPIPSTGASLG